MFLFLVIIMSLFRRQVLISFHSQGHVRLLLNAFSTSTSLSSQPPSSKPFNSDEHINIINKSTSPIVRKSVARDLLKNRKRAANSFATTSVFYDEVVNKFVNCMMKGGQKVVAQNVLRDAFEITKCLQLQKYHTEKDKSSIELDPLKIFHKAVQNSMPILGTQTMTKRKKFRVPYPLPENRRLFLAIKWLITTSRNRPGNSKPMSEKLSKELLDAYYGEGSVIQKKEEFHKNAESARALAHYRWW